MSLASYRQLVKKLATERDGTPVYNGSLDHAAIIVENMFANAQSYIGILTGKLNPRVYGVEEVVEQARLFLAEPNHKLEILLEDKGAAVTRDHPFYAAFLDFSNVSIRTVPPEMSTLFDFHLLVMDNDSYRFESDKRQSAAVADFGDVTGGKNLRDIFDQLWSVACKNPNTDVKPALEAV